MTREMEKLVRSRNPGEGMKRLEAVVECLRAPGGCPWDREQTLKTLRPCLMEEAYELLDAIDKDDLAAHKEELGDVLLQVVFQAQVRSEERKFNLDDVAHAISDKLVKRHPHVFADVKVADSREVLKNWEAIKKTERNEGGSPRPTLSGVPKNLPALLRAQRTLSKCSKVGFDWAKPEDALAKVREELAELQSAVESGEDKTRVEEEYGDLLFAVAAYGRRLGVNAEDALRGAIEKFAGRFNEIEAAASKRGVDMRSLAAGELMERWNAAKGKPRGQRPDDGASKG